MAKGYLSKKSPATKTMVKSAVHQHEDHEHGGRRTKIKLKSGGFLANKDCPIVEDLGVRPRPRKPKGFFFGGSSGSTSSTSTQYTTPGEFEKGFMKRIMDDADTFAREGFKPFTGERFAPFNEQQQQAFGRMGQTGEWAPYFNQAANYVTNAGGVNQSNTIQPYLDAAGAGPTATGAAQPFLASASKTFPQSVNEYMSPYTDAVVDRIGDLGVRNLTEKILPNVNNVFTGAQFGRDRHAEFTNRAIRDANESILGQQAQALESGYGTAGNLFNADANRAAGLAGTAGSLAATDTASKLGQGNLALSGANATQSGQLAAGTAAAGLSNQFQQQGSQDTRELLGAGQLQQDQANKQKDFNYEQWYAQNYGFPMQSIQTRLGVAQGLGLQTPTSTTSYGTTTGTPASGSLAGGILGGLTSLAGLATPGASGTSALGNIFGGLGGIFGTGESGGRVPQDLKPKGYFAAGGYAPTVRGLNGDMQRRMPAIMKRRQMMAAQQQRPPQMPMMKRGGYLKHCYAGGGPTTGDDYFDRSPFLNSRAPRYYGEPDPSDRPRPFGRGEENMDFRRPTGRDRMMREDPLKFLWDHLPRDVRDIHGDAGQFMIDITPPAAMRDAVYSSQDFARSVRDRDPAEATIKALETGLNALGALPGVAMAARPWRAAAR